MQGLAKLLLYALLAALVVGVWTLVSEQREANMTPARTDAPLFTPAPRVVYAPPVDRVTPEPVRTYDYEGAQRDYEIQQQEQRLRQLEEEQRQREYCANEFHVYDEC